MMLCPDIVSRSDHKSLKELLDIISNSLESRGVMRYVFTNIVSLIC